MQFRSAIELHLDGLGHNVTALSYTNWLAEHQLSYEALCKISTTTLKNIRT